MDDKLKQIAPTLIALIAGALVAMVSNWLGVKAPDTITVPVVVSAPAPVAEPVNVEGGRLLGLRAKLRAEIDRRAALPDTDPWHLSGDQATKAKALVGQLGDGHLLQLLIQYGPQIAALVIKILSMLAVLEVAAFDPPAFVMLC